LWIELMGRQSNAILTNETGVILGSIKRVTPDMSRLREVRTGIKYTPPPRQAGYKRNPMEPNAFIGLPATEFAEYTQAANWLTASFSGVGTLLAREAVLRSASGKLTSESVWYGLNEVLSLVRLTEFSPVVYRDTRGDVAGAYPFRLRSIPDADQIDVDGISNAVESAYGSRLQENTLEKERTALLAALRKAAKACDRQLLDVREGLVNSDQSEHYKECGELLLANMNDLHPGASEMAVDDFYALEPNARRTISIDPSISIHDNAQRYFRRYQKARDSREILLSRQMQIEQSSQHIARAIEDAERISTASELSALTQAIAAEIRQPQSSATREATAKPAYDGHKIRSLKSPDGWEILVGENSTSNDYLTTKVASPSDIWLHARAVPSAHAVIRAQNRPASVSTAAILLAAEQVARRSTAKHAGLVSVDYTLKKYVRKPRGSAPGQVTYTNEKTIDVIADNDE
jgi:predicted ribosome quality control (RQC) complex YloA/Tae2 family protein